MLSDSGQRRLSSSRSCPDCDRCRLMDTRENRLPMRCSGPGALLSVNASAAPCMDPDTWKKGLKADVLIFVGVSKELGQGLPHTPRLLSSKCNAEEP